MCFFEICVGKENRSENVTRDLGMRSNVWGQRIPSSTDWLTGWVLRRTLIHKIIGGVIPN